MAKQIIPPVSTTTQTAQPTAAQAYAQAYALALTAVKARKAAEKAAKDAQEIRDEEREAKRLVKDMTTPQTQTTHTYTPITLEDVEDTPATNNGASVAQWIIAASLSLGAILFLVYIIIISIH